MHNRSTHDCLAKLFIENKNHFSDILNGFLFDGRKVVHPQNLTELNAEMKAALKNKHGNWFVAQKIRDVFKQVSFQTDGKTIYALIGIENQRYVDYAMPVRAMLYDAIAYNTQIREISKQIREKHTSPNKINRKPKKTRQINAGEYLYGIRKEDALLPVVTIVIYWGKHDWDGHRSLHKLLNCSDSPEVLKWIPDYHFWLIEPRRMSDEKIKLFTTDVRRVFECIKYASDKKRLAQIISEDSAYHSMDQETVKLINSSIGANIPLPPKHSMEKVDMCKAIEDMIADGFKEGKEQGFKEGKEKGFCEGHQSGFCEGKELILNTLRKSGFPENKIQEIFDLAQQTTA